MRNICLVAVACLALLGICSRSLGWSGAGHMVIAAEAYRELSPKLRKKVGEILKAHPNFEKWKESFEGGSANLDLGLFVFMKASTWPDEIRRRGNPYDHPEWHYVDYPLKPPGFAVGCRPSPTNDVIYGIGQCERVLADAKAPAEERAAYLAWLIHLVGDLHQPLHCESLVNEVYPEGDKGGNSFYVRPATRGISLHSLWDGLLGTSGKPEAHLNDAVRLGAEHSRKSLKELGTGKTPEAWSLESRALAVEKAYLRGELKGSTSKDSARELPEGYTKAAKIVAEKQAALAGYRLADEVRSWVK